MEKQIQLKVQFIEQKNMLRDELDDLIDVHDSLLEEYGDLNDQLHEKDSIIQRQITEIRSLIRTKSDLEEARRRITALKDISMRYLANIDSLLIKNELLTYEKDSVVNVNKNINWKNYKLNKQNKQLAEKVNKGSVLEVIEIDVKTIRYRNTGKEVVTKYASKVQKIRTCFTLAANQFSEAENKEVYVQIINNGEIITSNEIKKTMLSDSIVEVTSSSSFEYNNIQMSYCFEWERLNALSAGIYFVKLIIDGNISAETTLKLR